MTSVTLPILHFNDVYNMASTDDNKVMRDDKLTRTSFDAVVRFSEKINAVRSLWAEKAEEARKKQDSNDKAEEEEAEHGLVLFSGDLFSPSVESMLTKGRNMVHLMNELAPDACVPGNHEFDFGRERFDQLTEFSNFNWILSNVKEYPQDKETKKVNFDCSPELLRGLREYSVFKRSGLVIGVIGLMSDNTMNSTLASAKANLKAYKMETVCMELSRKLRLPKDQDGEGCDIILALTHAEHNEDIALGKAVNAYPATKKTGLEDLEGVDAIFGGHNHNYYLGRGVDLLNASDEPKLENTEKDDDGLLIVKSGYDFFDLSEVALELEEKPNAKHRKYVIKSLKVTRHHMAGKSINPNDVRNSSMQKVLRRQFQNEVLRGLNVPVASLPEPIKFSSEDPRKYETPIGNWVTDIILKAYNDLGMDESKPPLIPTIFIMTGGSIRSNGLPKVCKARDIIALLPFVSPLVALQLSGKAIKDALEGALSLSGTGAQAPEKKDDKKGEGQPTTSDATSSGQFPVFSGIRVEWDSTKPAKSRVKTVRVPPKEGNEWVPIGDADEYWVLTNDYLAEGNIGFDSFKTQTQRSNSDIPMFQALLTYLGTIYSLKKLEETINGLDNFLDGKGQIPGLQLNPNSIQDMKKLVERVDEFIRKMDEMENQSELSQLRVSIKRAASALYGLTPDAYIPPLEIKPVDGRMVDVSKGKSE
ncbi:5'-nucleotidase, carboxy-terminal domain protein [Rhizoctonia solani 123E]|uniref:5'-nucleotidase, carboxy-terminal domain protein n=1 Tax=Rhizoctonia solani 123E TaxID=1423351 RepID=A0A074S2S4_9AGAM|nr:5'-nucleotidase, carboxy-terminal domain protein [Rhizoctonia solani 123E]